jgi:peptidoglycan hydrolase CwlO-like protein
MKKHILAVAIATTILFTFPATVKASQIPTVKISGESFDCIISDSRTYIPVRGVFEKLGYTVDWEATTKTVTFSKDSKVIVLNTVNSYVKDYGTLENKVINVDNRIYLPLRELTTLAGYEVNWDANSKTAEVLDTAANAISSIKDNILDDTKNIIQEKKEQFTETTTESEEHEEVVEQIMQNVRTQKRPSIQDLVGLIPDGE